MRQAARAPPGKGRCRYPGGTRTVCDGRCRYTNLARRWLPAPPASLSALSLCACFADWFPPLPSCSW